MNSLVLVANAAEGTISTLSLQGETLAELAVSAVGDGCSAFVVDHARDLLYVAVADAVVTMRLDRASGSLSEVSRRDDAGQMVSLDLAHDGTVLVGASYNGGYTTGWNVADGVLGEPVARFDHANAHCVLVDGDVVYVASLGDDLVAQYRISRDAVLSPLDPATVAGPEGSGPRHITVSGSNAYMVTEFSAEAIRFDVAAGGTLTRAESVRFDDPAAELKHSRFGADPLAGHLRWGADVHVAGNYLLCSERTASTITSIALDADGHLREVAAITPVPTQPRGFGVSDDGTLMVAVGERSPDAVLFRVADDGSLVELDRAKVGGKARWVRFV